MKKTVYSIFIVLLVAFSGCVQDNLSVTEPNVEEGADVTVRFSTVIPEYTTVQTRANGGVNDMWVLVFDQNGVFIVRKKANLSAQTETGGTFTVSLPSSTSTRYVHFICNYDWTGFNDTDMIGANATAVVALMSTNNTTFWARRELTGGINANSFPASAPIELLRNQAKISVTEEADNFTLTGFTIHKAPNKGTIAPFNTATGQFEERAITEPIGVSLMDALQNGISGDEKYLFERKNKNATTITTVIMQGTYEGTSYFYKIDLIDADKVRYDIERNYHYQVKIKSVTKAGYTNFADALAGASHNNTALDPIIERFPMISDGNSKLEVEKTLVILVEPNKPFSVWAKYYPDVNSTTVNNSSVSVTLASNEGALADGSLTFNPTTGIISATSAAVSPTEPATARIVVSKGDLARTVRVILRPAFTFNPVTINDLSPAMLTNGQNVPATLRFTIPNDFPDDLLPLPIQIYTQGLYPAGTGLQMVVENGIIHYVYSATSKGVQTVAFKTNKSGNAETVTVKADYFADGAVNYDIFKVTGTIKHGGANMSVPSGTNVPSGAVVSVSTGTLTISSAGQFVYTPPLGYNSNTSVSFTYEKQVNTHYKEVYTMTTTIGNLISNSNIDLTPVNFVFEGAVQYWWSNQWNNVLVSDPDLQTTLGNISKPENGRYRLIIPSSTTNNTSITVSISWNNTYSQSRTVSSLKSNAKLELRR